MYLLFLDVGCVLPSDILWVCRIELVWNFLASCLHSELQCSASLIQALWLVLLAMLGAVFHLTCMSVHIVSNFFLIALSVSSTLLLCKRIFMVKTYIYIYRYSDVVFQFDYLYFQEYILSWYDYIVFQFHHYCDVIMDAMASQITSLLIIYSDVYSGADQRKH